MEALVQLPGEHLVEGLFEERHFAFKQEVCGVVASIGKEIAEAQKIATFPFKVYKFFADKKLLGINFPENLGGRGLDTISCVILIEEVAKLSSSIAGIVATAGITAPYLILKHGTEEQKSNYLPKICEGKLIVAFAITEPNAGSDVNLLSTYATKEGDHYIINGIKTFISHAPVADLFLVTAQTGEPPGSCTVFILEKGTPGLIVSRKIEKLGWWCQETGEIYLNDVKVGFDQILGEEHAGLRIPMTSIGLTRVLLSAIAVGLTEQVLKNAIAVIRNSDFGSVKRRQSVRARISALVAQWLSVRVFLYQTAKALDRNGVFRAETSALKFVATELAKKTTQECLWLFGPETVNKFSLPSICYVDAPAFTIADGTSEIQLENIARGLQLIERVGQL